MNDKFISNVCSQSFRSSSGNLHLSGTLMKEFVCGYYTPRRLADLFACYGDWAAASERYQKVGHPAGGTQASVPLISAG